MPSFDIVCDVDLQEVDNAVNQTSREMIGRFDFKSGNSSVEFDREQKQLKITADDEMKLRAIHQILETKFAKRGIDCRALQYEKEEQTSNRTLKQKVTLRSGLSKEETKKITQLIKTSGLKVQPEIQDDQIRVTAKKIDDLQEVIAAVKQANLGIPLQYINMRR
jgi:uncharacterized protein YajQ (UPF0234 family)